MKCRVKACKREAIAGEPYCSEHRYQGTPSTGFSGVGPSEPPIVITGGSVTIEFDPSQLTPDGNGRLSNPDKKIRRIEITGDGINFAQDTPTGKVTIVIHYGDP